MLNETSLPPRDGEDWWGYYRHYGEDTVASALKCFDPLDIAHDRRRALAALCLHEQAFGFTREDVTFLRDVLAAPLDGAWEGDEWVSCGEDAEDRQRRLNLADRIEALLPPE